MLGRIKWHQIAVNARERQQPVFDNRLQQKASVSSILVVKKKVKRLKAVSWFLLELYVHFLT